VSADKYSPPKYFQISREIIGQIQEGSIVAGSPFLGNDIIAKCRVSNTTARKVPMSWKRKAGNPRQREGTYVRDYTVGPGDQPNLGFTKNMIEAGRKPSTRLLDFIFAIRLHPDDQWPGLYAQRAIW
jgi:GntR family transcriptional regulator